MTRWMKCLKSNKSMIWSTFRNTIVNYCFIRFFTERGECFHWIYCLLLNCFIYSSIITEISSRVCSLLRRWTREQWVYRSSWLIRIQWTNGNRNVAFTSEITTLVWAGNKRPTCLLAILLSLRQIMQTPKLPKFT